MCKQVSASMMIGYALNNRKVVSAERLRRKREALLREQGDILADVSFASIRKAVDTYSDMLRLRCSNGSYCICKTKNVGGSAKFFDKDYLKKLYSPAYSAADYSMIESVLAR